MGSEYPGLMLGCDFVTHICVLLGCMRVGIGVGGAWEWVFTAGMGARSLASQDAVTRCRKAALIGIAVLLRIEGEGVSGILESLIYQFYLQMPRFF